VGGAVLGSSAKSAPPGEDDDETRQPAGGALPTGFTGNGEVTARAAALISAGAEAAAAATVSRPTRAGGEARRRSSRKAGRPIGIVMMTSGDRGNLTVVVLFTRLRR